MTQLTSNSLGLMCQNMLNVCRPALSADIRKYCTLSRRGKRFLESSEFGTLVLQELQRNGFLNKMEMILATSYVPLSSGSLTSLGQGITGRNSSSLLIDYQQRRGFKTVRSQRYKGMRGSQQDQEPNDNYTEQVLSAYERRTNPQSGRFMDAYRSGMSIFSKNRQRNELKSSTDFQQFLHDVKHRTKPEVQNQLIEAYSRGMAETASLLNKKGQKESPGAVYGRRLLTILIIIGMIYSYNSIRTLINEAGRGGLRRSPNESYEVRDRVDVTFSDVKGCDEAKKELEDVVEFLRNPGRFNKLGARLPKGVLLTGQPGVGKTLLARAVAGEAKVPFLHAAGSEFDELFVGTGASRMRKLFEEAKSRAPCVVFIDEIDAVSSHRTNSPTHPYANQTINQLLSELDGFRPSTGIIVLGATNRRNALDPAVVRPGRFDMEVVVQIPDYAGRKAILELYLGKVKNIGIDIHNLAMSTIGFSGADIENMVNQAAILAGLENVQEVTMDHIWKARDKMLMGPARSRLQDEEANKITAYHEAGHALVAHYTPGSHPLHKITLIPRGMSLGATSFIPNKELHNETFQSLKASMDIKMGGRVAEEIIFGMEHVTTGAMSDFQQATSVAEAMVMKYGMSEAVGVRVLSKDKSKVSESSRELVDKEVKRLLFESYERARKILVSHAKEHKAIADALLKYETMSRDDIEDIIKGRKPKVAIEREKIEAKAEEEKKQNAVTGLNSIINLFGGKDKIEKEDLVKPIGDPATGGDQRR